MSDKLCMHGAPHKYVPADDDAPLLADVAKIARDGLRETYDLVYINYDDRFTSEQVSVLLSGANPWEHDLFEGLMEWEGDVRRDGSAQVLRDLLTPEQVAVLEDTDEWDELTSEIEDRDRSSWFDQMLRNTPHMLMRYDLDVSYDGNTDTDPQALGLSIMGGVEAPSALVQLIREMLPEQEHYGGSFELIWYGDVAQWHAAVSSALDGKQVSVTMTDFHLLIRDGWNGSGYDRQVNSVPFTFILDPAKLCTDVNGGGYSWTDIAGPYPPAYTASVSIVTTDAPFKV